VIENNAFSNLNNLKKLKLNMNKIRSLDEGVFSYLNKLEDLDLSRNNISYLHKDLFVDLTSLKYLDLADNGISKIESFTFKNLFKLVTLNISVNNVNLNIEKNGLVGLSSLKTLNMSIWVLIKNDLVKFNIKDDLKNLRLYRKIGTRDFYESVNIIGDKTFRRYNDELFKFKLTECHLVLFFIKYNILFNLRDEYDLYVFNKNCLNLKIEQSFFVE
jgi:hypothetical protein